MYSTAWLQLESEAETTDLPVSLCGLAAAAAAAAPTAPANKVLQTRCTRIITGERIWHECRVCGPLYLLENGCVHIGERNWVVVSFVVHSQICQLVNVTNQSNTAYWSRVFLRNISTYPPVCSKYRHSREGDTLGVTLGQTLVTFQHGFDGDRLFGYLNVDLEDFPIGALQFNRGHYLWRRSIASCHKQTTTRRFGKGCI